MFNLYVLSDIINSIKEIKINLFETLNGLDTVNFFKEKNLIKSLENIDLIILDCEMPIMDGYDAAKEIKKLINEQKHINCVIIGYTSHTSEKELKKCFDSGMDDTWHKPSKTSDIINNINSYFKKKLNSEEEILIYL